jgi:hypothetical protein
MGIGFESYGPLIHVKIALNVIDERGKGHTVGSLEGHFGKGLPALNIHHHLSLLSTGHTQLKGSQQTIVQSQLPGQTIQVQSQPVAQAQFLQQQVKQGSTHVQGTQSIGKTPGKSPAQRRRSQNK